MKINKTLVFRMYSVLIFWTTFFFFAIFVPRRFQYRFLFPIFLNLYLFAAKIKPVYLGGTDLNSYKGVIFGINHKSFVDSQMVMSLLKNPFTLLYRREVFKSPFFRFMAWKVGFIPIEGAEALASKNAFDAMINKLEKGVSILYFPEGRHIVQSHTGKFQKGIAKLAKASDKQVVPIALYGIDDKIRFEKKLIWRKVYIKAGEPIKYSQYDDDELFISALKDRIQTMYFEMHDKYNLINY